MINREILMFSISDAVSSVNHVEERTVLPRVTHSLYVTPSLILILDFDANVGYLFTSYFDLIRVSRNL